MPPLSVQRKRKNFTTSRMDNVDELSESGTSGSSYRPSDSSKSSDDSCSSSEDSSSETEEPAATTSKHSKTNDTKTKKTEDKYSNKTRDFRAQSTTSGSKIDKKTDTRGTEEANRHTKDSKVYSKKGNKKVFKRETVERACDRLKKGESIGAIAADLSVNEKIIKQWNEKFVVKGEPICGSKKKVVESKGATSKSSSGVAESQIRDWQKKNEDETKKTTICEALDQIDSHASSGGESDLEEILKIPVKKRTAFCRNIVRREAVKRLKEGQMASTVAKDLGLATNTVREWRRKFAPHVINQHISKFENHKNTVKYACNRLKLGDSVADVAKRLHMGVEVVDRWKKRYMKETENGEIEVRVNIFGKYDKSTIIEACKRLKQGDAIHDVANDLGIIDLSTIKRWFLKYENKEPDFAEEYYKKYNTQMKMEVIDQLKKGEFPTVVAKKLGVNITTVYNWKREYDGLKLEKRGATKFHKDIIMEVCKRLQRGESVTTLARTTKIASSTIKIWRQKYMKHGRIKITESSAQDVWKFDKDVISKASEKLKDGASIKIVAKKIGITAMSLSYWLHKYFPDTASDSSDAEDFNKNRKLRSFKDSEPNESSQTDVEELSEMHQSATTENSLANEYCQASDESLKRKTPNLQNRQKFVPLRKVYIPKKTKLEVASMIDNGVSIANLSRELNINKVILKSWVMNKHLLQRKYKT